jgi:predicted nucleic acid-binding protein
VTSADRPTYLDSSAIVKLVLVERESGALRAYLRGRRPLTSALARVEVGRAARRVDAVTVRRAAEVVAEIDVIRISERVLARAERLRPDSLRSLDAIHVATALEVGSDLDELVTYDARLRGAAETAGLRVAVPA